MHSELPCCHEQNQPFGGMTQPLLCHSNRLTRMLPCILGHKSCGQNQLYGGLPFWHRGVRKKKQFPDKQTIIPPTYYRNPPHTQEDSRCQFKMQEEVRLVRQHTQSSRAKASRCTVTDIYKAALGPQNSKRQQSTTGTSMIIQVLWVLLPWSDRQCGEHQVETRLGGWHGLLACLKSAHAASAGCKTAG